VKRLVRLVLLLAVLAAIAVIASRLRERRAPAPEAGLPGVDLRRSTAPEETSGEATVPDTAEAGESAGPDDLARVWGIGPIYRARLAEIGISTFTDLAAAAPAAVVEATGVPAARAADWIAQAAALAAR